MKIKKTLDNKLCLGCGLCKALCNPGQCEMKLNETGFYYPSFNTPISADIDNEIAACCPAITEKGSSHSGKWGKIKMLYQAWSADEEIRFKAASGGVTTSLAIHLLESGKVDAVLQVGVRDDSYLYNQLKISRSKEDIISNAQSRYAPALVFTDLFRILDNSNDTFCFIGKPCDVACIRNIIRNYPQYKDRFRYLISIFCAGMPSYLGTRKTWEKSGKKEEPNFLMYRGNGWPGYFTARWEDGTEYKLSYNESWGTILGRTLGLRCKVCPDGIGLLADIAIGDYWNTKDGFPDFTEGDGKCFVMVRTENGANLFNECLKGKTIEGSEINIDNIQDVQPYQYQRRKLTLWRLIPLQLKTGFLLNFKGLSIIRQGLTAKPIDALKNFYGMIRRM